MFRLSCIALAAASLLLTSGPGHAADSATCKGYVAEAVAKAQAVRRSACGYDAGDPRWGASRDAHARWCRSASKTTVAAETAQRRGQVKLCQVCRNYADLATTAAADNAKSNCGFTGPRWSANASDHFDWCMAMRDTDEAAKAIAADSYAAVAAAIEQSLAPETGDRTLSIETCKLRQPAPRKRGPRRPRT
jgi:hypothetical protein